MLTGKVVYRDADKLYPMAPGDVLISTPARRTAGRSLSSGR